MFCACLEPLEALARQEVLSSAQYDDLVNTLNIQFLGLVKIWPKLFAFEKKKNPREDSEEAFKNAEQKSNESYNLLRNIVRALNESKSSSGKGL